MLPAGGSDRGRPPRCGGSAPVSRVPPPGVSVFRQRRVTSLSFCCSVPAALFCLPHEPASSPGKDRGPAPAIFSPAGLSFERFLSSIERDHLFSACFRAQLILDATQSPRRSYRIVHGCGARRWASLARQDANSKFGFRTVRGIAGGARPIARGSGFGRAARHFRAGVYRRFLNLTASGILYLAHYLRLSNHSRSAVHLRSHC